MPAVEVKWQHLFFVVVFVFTVLGVILVYLFFLYFVQDVCFSW